VRLMIAGVIFAALTAAQSAPGDASKAGSQWTGEEFHSVFGFEQTGASGSDSVRKFFLDFFVSRPVPGLFGTSNGDGEPRLRWWGDVRIASAPRSMGSAISAGALASSAASLKFNEMAQTAEFVTGIDVRMSSTSGARGKAGDTRQRFRLSFVAGFGASGSLTSAPPFSTVPAFQNPVNSPLYGSFMKAYPAAAEPAYQYVAFLPPFPDRYFKEYFGGFRLTTRYADEKGNGLRTPPAMITATIGQNELITAGRLRGVVSRVEAFYPLSTGKQGIWSAIFLFATAQLHWGGARAATFPLMGAPANALLTNTNTLYITDRPSRDDYAIGAGVDLLQFLNTAKIVWK